MPISIACPGCGQSYKVSSKLAGQTARCKNCDLRFTIAGPASTAAPAEGEALFAGMNLDEMLGAGASHRHVSQPEQMRGFTLPSERAVSATAEAAPMPSMLIEGLGDTKPRKRPRGIKLGTVWQGVPLGGVGEWVSRVSPVGLTMIISGLSFAWVISNTEGEAAKSQFFNALPWFFVCVGVIVTLAGLLGITPGYRDRMGRFAQVWCCVPACALAGCLLMLWGDPAAAASVVKVAMVLVLLGGVSFVGAGLWSIGAMLKENAGIGVMLILVLVGGTAMNVAFRDPVLRVILDLIALVLMLIALVTCWSTLARPFAVGTCGLMVMLTAAAFIGFGRTHGERLALQDSQASAPWQAPPPEQTGITALQGRKLPSEWAELDGIAIRPPQGWKRTANYWESPTPGRARLQVFSFPARPGHDELTGPVPIPPNRELREDRVVEINGIPMRVVRFQSAGAVNRTPLAFIEEEYHFRLAGLSHRIECIVHRNGDQGQWELIRRAVGSVKARPDAVFAMPPASLADIPDDAMLAPSDHSVELVYGVTLALPRGITQSYSYGKHPEYAFNTGSRFRDLSVSVEPGRGEGLWPKVLVSGPSATTPAAVVGHAGDYQFSRVGEVPVVWTLNPHTRLRKDCIAHVHGDRYVFSLSGAHSKDDLEHHRIIEAVVRTLKPAHVAADSSSDRPLTHATCEHNRYTVRMPLRYVAQSIGSDKYALVRIGTPDGVMDHDDGLTWWISPRRSTHDITEPGLTIEGNQFELRIPSQTIKPYFVSRSLVQTAAGPLVRFVEQERVSDWTVWWIGDYGSVVVAFKARGKARQRPDVYDAIVESLRPLDGNGPLALVEPLRSVVERQPVVEPASPPSVVRAPATPPAREVSSSSPEPAESDAQLTSSQPATVSIRPSPTALSQLGETVAINDRFSFRPPRDLTGRMSGGRTGQWRGSGNVQRVVGLDVSVRPADGLVDPVQVAPSGQQQLRTHDQWTTLGDAAVDRLSVGGLLVTRVRMPAPASARIGTTHYVTIEGDQVLTITARYDPTRPQQREVLEAAVSTLQRSTP